MSLIFAAIVSLVSGSFIGAEQYAVAVLSPKTGGIRASAVLIHEQAALTAAHATGEAGTLISLRCKNGVVNGVVTKRNVVLDLAIVEFEGVCESRVVEIASTDLSVGEPLTIVGFPGGRFLIISSGIVAGFDIVSAGGFARYALLSDIDVYPGNSGGPVLSQDQKLVAIITGRVCFSDEDQPPKCYASSVPISLIRLFLALL